MLWWDQKYEWPLLWASCKGQAWITNSTLCALWCTLRQLSHSECNGKSNKNLDSFSWNTLIAVLFIRQSTYTKHKWNKMGMYIWSNKSSGGKFAANPWTSTNYQGCNITSKGCSWCQRLISSISKLWVSYGYGCAKTGPWTYSATEQRVNFYHYVVFTVFSGETYMYPYLTWYPVRSMDGLSTSAAVSWCHLLHGFSMQECSKISNFYVRHSFTGLDYN